VFNRRTHVRVHPKPGEPVEVQISGDDFIDMFDVRDISPGGLGVAAPHLVTSSTVGSKIEMVIKLPRQKAFVARGTIRNVSRQGILGIEFTDLPAADRARIQHYVEGRLAEGGAAA
jgi:c-di-GMP-binding flagellar brake protein YcgR